MKKCNLVLCACICSGLALADAADFPPPCDPVAVKKPVKVVRREIKVSIIGANRPYGPSDISKATAEAVAIEVEVQRAHRIARRRRGPNSMPYGQSKNLP